VPEFRDAYFIFIPESNMAPESQYYAKKLARFPKFITLQEGKTTGIGAHTTNTMKLRYTEEMEMLLRTDSISFSTKMVVASPFVNQNAPETNVAAMKDTITKQLNQFKRVTHIANNVFNRSKTTYSGKVNGEGKEVKGLNDDIAITTMMACYWAKMFYMKRTSAPYDSLPRFDAMKAHR
jgi:hypothetical protein